MPQTTKRMRTDMSPVVDSLLREGEKILWTRIGLVGPHPLMQALALVPGRAWLVATDQRLLAIWLARTNLSPTGYEEWERSDISFGPWRGGMFPGAEMLVGGRPATTIRFQRFGAEEGLRLIAALSDSPESAR